MANPAPLILIVDDEPPIRRLVHTSLNDEGYRVAEAESGQQAVRLAAQQPPDVVILDLGLPDMDGHAVLRKLREWLRAPIIILSARDQEKEKVAALDHGADDYLTKPFSTGELLARFASPCGTSMANDQAQRQFQVGDLTARSRRRVGLRRRPRSPPDADRIQAALPTLVATPARC